MYLSTGLTDQVGPSWCVEVPDCTPSKTLLLTSIILVSPPPPPHRGRTEFIDKSSKFIYFSILSPKTSAHPSQTKWNNKFPTDFTRQIESDWQPIYKTPFLALRETKLQSFQLKVLYRIIPCNHYLKTLRIRDSDSCSYCNDPDTIEHFLYDCPRVQQLWSQFRSWFDNETNIDITVSRKEFFLGVLSPRRNVKVIFVHRQKLVHNCEISLVSLLAEIKSKLRVEKIVCTLQNKTHHFDKWDNILLALG